MSSKDYLCQICAANKFKYACPKCNILYCSVACYKDKSHLRCSEEFYKQWIQDEQQQASNEKHKEALRKMQNLYSLDSDDDFEESEQMCDLLKRMEGVDLENSTEVWNNLTAKEKEIFSELCESGEIVKVLPYSKPWWEIKIVEIDKEVANESNMPEIIILNTNKKNYAAQLPFNLINIIASYALVSRLYRGDFADMYYEAAVLLINLSSVLKEDGIFEKSDEALNSVIMEASTLPKNMSFVCEYLENLTLIKDAEVLNSNKTFKLAALSDSLRLIKAAKKQYEKSNEEMKNELKAHCISVQIQILETEELRKIIKKLEFFLAYCSSLES